MSAESLWEPYTPVRPQLPRRPDPPDPPAPPPTPRRFRRLVSIVGIALVVLLVGGAGVMYVATQHLGNNVVRVPDAFGGIDEAARPPSTEALTFLLVGTDSRTEGAPRGAVVDPNSGADVVMVAHIAPDRRSATVVSIPRDSWLEIPDNGPGRVSRAYQVGGPSLLIRTVEQLTALRIDHFAVVDFAGFRSVVDTIGGVDVDVPAPVAGFERGRQHMDGAQALGYLRDRSGVGDGDRARRQHSTLRAILDKAVSTETLTDPVRLYDFLDAVSQSIGVDDSLSNGGLSLLAIKLSELRASNVLFLRAPVAKVDRDGQNLVVQLDTAHAGGLWGAVRQGTAPAYVLENGRDALGPVIS